mgnify:CR=1 FL=1
MRFLQPLGELISKGITEPNQRSADNQRRRLHPRDRRGGFGSTRHDCHESRRRQWDSVPGVCVYGSQDTQATVFVYAQTIPDTTTADSISPDQMAAILNGQYGVSNAKAVTGVGDKAFEYTTTSSGNTGIAIFVFKANAVLMIVMSPTTNSTAIEKLARTAVGHL